MKKLPRWVAITVWAFGFVVLLAGEFLAVGTDASGDTISEVVWWIMGIGQGITWYYLLSRIAVFGLLGWLFLHFGTRKV